MKPVRIWQQGPFWLWIAILVTCLVYFPGLSGGWLLDDYPSIVSNPAVQPPDLTASHLAEAALSSTTSTFKRPLASLSFALNYRMSGLDPFSWKVVNLVIHLVNGWLIFLLARGLLRSLPGTGQRRPASQLAGLQSSEGQVRNAVPLAALIAGAWMLLPINLTAVLYVVQRMESLANVFVLLGLVGYVAGRRRMFGSDGQRRGLALCIVSLTIPTAVGMLAKETAVMLPLYALLIEWIVFEFKRRTPETKDTRPTSGQVTRPRLTHGAIRTDGKSKGDWCLALVFVLVLVLPMLVGLAWVIPRVLDPATWAAREFTLGTRLLSEARIVIDYIGWTLLPMPSSLSFYHDSFTQSTGLLSPWTTLTSLTAIVALLASVFVLKRRRPLIALGIALFLGCHALTATILPLELIFEHRNYFASFGLLLVVIPWLTAPTCASMNGYADYPDTNQTDSDVATTPRSTRFSLVRYALLGALVLTWAAQTAVASLVWGSPLVLSRTLAERAPESPRAQYALGRDYSILTGYDPASPMADKARATLQKAAKLPGASILPLQALILMNARMHVPTEAVWWNALLSHLRANQPTVQDMAAVRALSICAIRKLCDLPQNRMTAAFTALLSHPDSPAQMYARYGEYAWNVMHDKGLAERMMSNAVQKDPGDPDYRLSHIQMLVSLGHKKQARKSLRQLETLNYGGRLDSKLQKLRSLPGMQARSNMAD